MIGRLTLDQLRVLVAIADTGSFSAAGRKLDRVQSAISQSVAALEDAQGVTIFDRAGHRPKLTDVGRVLVEQARSVLGGAAMFEVIASNTRNGLEPELAIAIDPLVPTSAFIDSLQALRSVYPHLPVSFSTEGLGGAERRIRNGEAAIAFCLLLPRVPEDVVALPLLDVPLIPVVSPHHDLAQIGGPVSPAEIERHVQLVLSDPSKPGGTSYGVIGARAWRFVDLGRRLDFLLAGFGWCRMPEPLVAPMLADGRLVHLSISDDPADANGALTIYAAHMRSQALGQAGRWLLEDLKLRFTST